jgi:hypothetical protein
MIFYATKLTTGSITSFFKRIENFYKQQAAERA